MRKFNMTSNDFLQLHRDFEVGLVEVEVGVCGAVWW